MIWFTADTHFGHAKLLEYEPRPFASVEAMDEALISYWNSVVDKNDTIYHLGDFGLQNSDEYVHRLLSRLKGNKILIFGNHDRKAVLRCPLWGSVHETMLIKVRVRPTDRHRQKIRLCHFAWRTWNSQHHDAWMLHGHSHGHLYDIGGKSMDVGVDSHNYFPISLDAIDVYMAHRPAVSWDHHQHRPNNTEPANGIQTDLGQPLQQETAAANSLGNGDVHQSEL